MEPELLPRTSDLVFKMLFGAERNTDILCPFLNAVLRLPEDVITEVTLMNPYQGYQAVDAKKTILDVKVKTATGRRIDIEMQVRDQHGLTERITFTRRRCSQNSPCRSIGTIC